MQSDGKRVFMQATKPDVVDSGLSASDAQGQSMPRFTDGCRIERLSLGDGLTLVRSFCCPSRDLTEKIDQSDGRPTLVITFGLSGESGYVERAGTRLRFRQGHTTLSVFSSCQGERQFAAGTPVRQLRLSVGETALRHYLGAPGALLPHRMGVRALGERATSPWCLPLVRSLASPGSISHLDAHIAALSLVGEHLRALGPLAGSDPTLARWTPVDMEKLRRARDLMYSQMDRALTISYLCISVGINEFKLKRGFREIYGATPYQALLEMRMQRARQLLESGSQVAQVAYAVGYTYPANFSTAFERYFGYRPKYLRARCKE